MTWQVLAMRFSQIKIYYNSYYQHSVLNKDKRDLSHLNCLENGIYFAGGLVLQRSICILDLRLKECIVMSGSRFKGASAWVEAI